MTGVLCTVYGARVYFPGLQSNFGLWIDVVHLSVCLTSTFWLNFEFQVLELAFQSHHTVLVVSCIFKMCIPSDKIFLSVEKKSSRVDLLNVDLYVSDPWSWEVSHSCPPRRHRKSDHCPREIQIPGQVIPLISEGWSVKLLRTMNVFMKHVRYLQFI